MRRSVWLCLILSGGLLLLGHWRSLVSSPPVVQPPPALASLAVESRPIPPRVVDPFPRPAGLDTAIAFWRHVFGHWRRDHVVLHDDTHLGIVYEIVPLSKDRGSRIPQAEQRRIDQRQRHLRRTLQDLEYRVARQKTLSPDQQRLWELITESAGPAALPGASRRLRQQRGMRESFQRSVEAGRRYDRRLRQVFRDMGLPEDLAYLPHVESAFATRARSPVGAVGLWQFMPATGRQFLRITRTVDDRYDPLRATRGAARLFTEAYSRLQNWALVITAYNYGLPGMLRAMQVHGPDIEAIIRSYQSPSFGFASRNYYVEFLAVRDLMRHLPDYFPEEVKM